MECPDCGAETKIVTIGAPIMGIQILHKPGCKRVNALTKQMKMKRYG